MSKSKKSGLAGSFILDEPSNNADAIPNKEIGQKSNNSHTGERVNARTPERENVRTGEQVNARTPVPANSRTGKRVIKRHSYNFYKDQVDQLNWLDLQKKMQGDKDFNMSKLVRDAIDTSLKKLQAKGEFDGYTNG